MAMYELNSRTGARIHMTARGQVIDAGYRGASIAVDEAGVLKPRELSSFTIASMSYNPVETARILGKHSGYVKSLLTESYNALGVPRDSLRQLTFPAQYIGRQALAVSRAFEAGVFDTAAPADLDPESIEPSLLHTWRTIAVRLPHVDQVNDLSREDISSLVGTELLMDRLKVPDAAAAALLYHTVDWPEGLPDYVPTHS